MSGEQAAVAVATRSPLSGSRRTGDPAAAPAPGVVVDPHAGAPARSGLTRLLAASFVSFLGDGMLAVALPLLAASLSRSPVAVSAVVAARTAPWLVFGLLAGVFVDRGARRMMMVATDVARGLAASRPALGGARGRVATGVALGVATGHLGIGLLCRRSFVLGTADTVHDCASSAILPAVVEGDDIDRANSLLFTGETISDDLAGRALGGILFTAAIALPFFFDAVSFL